MKKIIDNANPVNSGSCWTLKCQILYSRSSSASIVFTSCIISFFYDFAFAFLSVNFNSCLMLSFIACWFNFQHDINEKQLKVALDGVVEDAVGLVGADLNVASEALLRYGVTAPGLSLYVKNFPCTFSSSVSYLEFCSFVCPWHIRFAFGH